MKIHDISHNISTDISKCIWCDVSPEPSFDPSKLPYQALWTANGKTNDDVDNNVPNLVDPANPLVCSNFAWVEESGYSADGLYFNGVDDLFQSEKSLPALEKYTVVGDFDIITPKGKGFIKYKNWYIYKNIVRISSSISYTVVTDAFAISSSGLVVTKSGSLVTSEVGTETSLSQIISDVSLQGIFRSLAIIPEELNEEQIRAVYEYLKTLKANNI